MAPKNGRRTPASRKGWGDRRDYYHYRTVVRPKLFEDNERDNGGRCQLAIEGVCTGKATQVHHTLGIAVTGHDPRYMVVACQPCNRRVGEPEKSVDPPHVVVTEW